MVITWPFSSCYFLGVCRTCTQPQATSEAITFEPIKIQTRSASQNDLQNLSFVKDKQAYGNKMARKGPTTINCQYFSFPIRVYFVTIKALSLPQSAITYQPMALAAASHSGGKRVNNFQYWCRQKSFQHCYKTELVSQQK